jgi:hypothetical protein
MGTPVDELRNAVRFYAAGISLQQSLDPAATTSLHMRDLIYEEHDYQALREYLAPRSLLAFATYTQFNELRRDSQRFSLAHMRAASKRAHEEYVACRRALLLEANARAHMSSAQRQLLVGMWLSALVWPVLVQRAETEEARRAWPVTYEAQDFDLVAKLAEESALQLAVSDARLDSYSLRQWNTAFDLLCYGFAESGAVVDDGRAYWTALWDSFLRFASGQAFPVELADESISGNEEDPMAAVSPAELAAVERVLASLGSSLASMRKQRRVVSNESGSESGSDDDAMDLDEPEDSSSSSNDAAAPAYSPILDYSPAVEQRRPDRKDAEATPIEHAGVAVKLSYLLSLESRYYAHVLSLDAVDAFAHEARLRKNARLSRMFGTFLHKRAAEAIRGFLLSPAIIKDKTAARGIRDNVGRKLAGAHLQRGEMEYYYIATVENARAKQRTDGVDPKPLSDHVLAQLRQADYTKMLKFRLGEQAVGMALEGLLRTEINLRHASVKRDPTERFGLLLLVEALDYAMAVRKCPPQLLLGRCSFIEELEEDCTVPKAPPASVLQAALDLTRDSGAAYIRIMRRNFIVARAPGRESDERYLLEVPHITTAILLWLICSPRLGQEWIPTTLWSLVKKGRDQSLKKRR